jgi:hypothetical protein
MLQSCPDGTAVEITRDGTGRRELVSKSGGLSIDGLTD